jgi:copper chaperone CopZ
MTCGNCVRHVHAALVEIPGVVAVVDLESATASVDHPASVTVQHLIEALDEAGYDATPRDAERR